MKPLFLSSVSFCLLMTPQAPAAEVMNLANGTGDRYEWRCSTFKTSAQHEAALDVGPNGEIVAVWSSRRQQQGRPGVYAQRFTAQGVAVGSEFAIGQTGGAHQSNPVVVADAAGNTWFAWQAHGQDGQAGGIFARRFDSAFQGSPEVQVNQQWRGHQSAPVIAASPSGAVVVVWTSASPTGGSSKSALTERVRVCARLFNADGSPASDEFAVVAETPLPSRTAAGASGFDEPAERSEMGPAVACSADGGFAVVYGIFDAAMQPAGIRMQRLDAAGRPIGREINVSGPARASQIEPAVASLPDGYVVCWLDAESDGHDYGVLARRFDGEGRPLCDPFVVNTQCWGPQNAVAVAAAEDGRFAVAWNARHDVGIRIYAQMFASGGAKLGDEFLLTKSVRSEQAMRAATGSRRLAFGGGGELLCIWSGDAGFDDKCSANVTMLSPQPIDLRGKSQGVTAEMRPALAVRDDGSQADGKAKAAQPHEPPTFDPKRIDHAEREIVREGETEFTAIVDSGWTPPDPHMAVGPEHIVCITNGAIAFFTKDGDLTFQDEIEDSFGFWGEVGASGFVFDPEVLYDELSGRFFAMAAEAWAPPGGTHSYVLVAVSDDPDPNGTWHKYRFDTTGLAGDLFDSPNMAVDANAMYITGDGFGITSNYPVYTFDKASLLAGNPPAITRSLTLPTSTQSAGIPPVSYDNPPALYMIEHAEGASGSTTVRLIALRDPLGSPYFTTHTMSVAQYYPPEDPPQLGTSSRPETFDARFWSVAYRNGSLWATHHMSLNPSLDPRVRARWYEIAMNGWPTSGQTPTLVQWGQIYSSSGGQIRAFFPSITVDDAGNAAMTFARSSPTEYISMVTAYRLADDAPGTFQPPVIRRTSVGPYSSGRWGDYSGVGADPALTDVFWTHHEYAENGSWRTWVAQIVLPPKPGDVNCDGAVDLDDVPAFVLALVDPVGYEAAYPNCNIDRADLNADTQRDGADVQNFVDLLAP